MDIKKNSILEWAFSKIIDFCNKKGYGSLTFVFENGKITRVKLEESMKPPQDKCNKKII